MSKLSDYLDDPSRTNGSKKELIIEEKLNNNDKKSILSLIENPKKTTLLLKSYSENYTEDEREVKVNSKAGGKMVYLEYNSDFYDITDLIVDYCDKNEIDFKSGLDRHTKTQWFRIMK